MLLFFAYFPPISRNIQFLVDRSNRHNRMSMKGGLCKPTSQAVRQARAGPMEAPLAAASSEGSGRQHNHHRLLSAGFDRLRWAATAVDTEQCRHSLLCHLSRMRDQALPRASLCRSSSTKVERQPCADCQQTRYALKSRPVISRPRGFWGGRVVYRDNASGTG